MKLKNGKIKSGKRKSNENPQLHLFEHRNREFPTNGVVKLDPNLTINSITEKPFFRYVGGEGLIDADRAVPYGYGQPLYMSGSGTAITSSLPTPFMGKEAGFSIDSGSGNVRVFMAQEENIYDVNNEDLVIEMIWKQDAKGVGLGNYHIFWDKGSGDTGKILYITSNASQIPRMFLSGSGGSAFVNSVSLTKNAWYYAILTIDKSALAQWHIGGEATGSTTDISSVGNISNTKSKFALMNNSDPSSGHFCGTPVVYVAMWKRDAWLDTHLQTSIAKERYHKLFGTYPRQNKSSTKEPVVCSRASTAFLEKQDGATSFYNFLMPENTPRIEKKVDASGKEVVGYRGESQSENVCKWSEDFNSWTPTNLSSVDVANTDHPTPFEGKYFDGMIGTAANTAHAYYLPAFAENLTAQKYTFSCFHKAGSDGWVRYTFYQASLGYVTCYYNLIDGTLGTPSQCDAGIIDYGGGIYRCWMTPTSSLYAEAANLYIYSSDGDGDATTVGDGSTVQNWSFGAQMEPGTFPTSYIGPTVTTKVIRQRDQLRYLGNDIINNTDREGTITANVLFETGSSSTGSYAFSLNQSGSINDQVACFFSGSAGSLYPYIQIRSGGNYEVEITGTTDFSDNKIKNIKLTYADNNVNFYVDNTSEGSSTSCTIPSSLDRVEISSEATTARQLNGIISDFKIFKKIQ